MVKISFARRLLPSVGTLGKTSKIQLDSESQGDHLIPHSTESSDFRPMNFLRSFRLLLLLSSLGSAQGTSDSTSIDVSVDGAKKLTPGPQITVPHNTASLRFMVNPGVPRTRYQLVNVDQKWREKTDEMLFIIRFFKKNGDQVSQEVFPAIGTSRGWNGTWEKSVFISRRETVRVPLDADRISVVISSAGPPTLVGVFAVSGITIQSKVDGGASGAVYLKDSRVPNHREAVWGRSGTHPTMATEFHLDDGDEKSPIFVINDDDIRAHADWITGIRALPMVVPGETLELQWSETYSSSVGGPFSIVYERLPVGIHRFEVEELSIAGVPLGVITQVKVTVPRPYWESVWFWTACVAIIALLSTLGGRYLIRKKIDRHLERAQLISDERLRIARDLHDDLGTRLSHISLLSAFAHSGSPNHEDRSNFEQITSMSRELIGALSETVWMLNPNNNQLEALVDFLCRLVSELCRLAEIRCRIDALSVTEDVSISHEFRHNISLAVKEVVNNALKHSHATETTMTIRVEGKLLIITVTDNGIGMTQSTSRHGLGLDSITQRMGSIRGKCDIQPLDSGGLKVTLEAPFN